MRRAARPTTWVCWSSCLPPLTSPAPEVLSDRGGYSPLCDIWSLGVILFQLCGHV